METPTIHGQERERGMQAGDEIMGENFIDDMISDKPDFPVYR
jgi:hypothetical protein